MLWIGAELVDKDGEVFHVEQIYREKLEKASKKVYNFKVDDYRTYFVGNCAVWVHNAEGCGIQKNGYVDAEKIAEDPSEFSGKSINDYANPELFIVT